MKPHQIAMRGLLIGLTLWLGRGETIAQVSILYGGHTLPDSGTMTTWFVDTLSHRGWRWNDTAWFEFCSGKVLDIVRCHREMYVHLPNSYLTYSVTGTPRGQVRNYLCADSIRARWEWDKLVIYHADGEEISHVPSWCTQLWIDTIPQTVNGLVGYNTPYWQRYQTLHDCSTLRTWGILGANGKWLIPPQFDGPFRFKNGLAEVIYYGLQRKINEKGEFVE